MGTITALAWALDARAPDPMSKLVLILIAARLPTRSQTDIDLLAFRAQLDVMEVVDAIERLDRAGLLDVLRSKLRS